MRNHHHLYFLSSHQGFVTPRCSSVLQPSSPRLDPTAALAEGDKAARSSLPKLLPPYHPQSKTLPPGSHPTAAISHCTPQFQHPALEPFVSFIHFPFPEHDWGLCNTNISLLFPGLHVPPRSRRGRWVCSRWYSHPMCARRSSGRCTGDSLLHTEWWCSTHSAAASPSPPDGLGCVHLPSLSQTFWAAGETQQCKFKLPHCGLCPLRSIKLSYST